MAFAYTEKDPDAVLDYTFDWTRWLNGAVIVTTFWTVPIGINVDNQGPDVDGKKSTVWLSGGTPGVDYDCMCDIISSTGTKDNRTLKVHVREK